MRRLVQRWTRRRRANERHLTGRSRMLAGSIQDGGGLAEPLVAQAAPQAAMRPQSSAESREQLEAVGGAVLFVTRLRRRAAAGLHRAVSVPVSAGLRRALPPMSAEQTLALSPWQKWREFNRVPVKFILQVVLVSAQTYFYASAVLPYFNQSSGSFASNFYGYVDASGTAHSAAAATAYGGYWSLDISTIPDFGASLESTLHAYERFVNESIDGYVTEPPIPTVRGVATCAPLPAGRNESQGTTRAAAPDGTADAASTRHSSSSNSSSSGGGGGGVAQQPSALCGTFELSRASPRGPFVSALPPAEWRRFFDSVVSVDLSWVLVDTQVDFLSHFGVGAFEVEWTLRAEYSFASAGQMRVVYSSSCQPGPLRPGSRAAVHTAAAGSNRLNGTAGAASAGGGGHGGDAAAGVAEPAAIDTEGTTVNYRLPIPLMNLAQVVVSSWLFLLCGRSLCAYTGAVRRLRAQAVADLLLEQQQEEEERQLEQPTPVIARGSAASLAPTASVDDADGALPPPPTPATAPTVEAAGAAAGARAPPPPPRIAWAWMLMIMVQCVVNVAASLTQCDPLKAAFFDSGGLLLGMSVALTWFNGMRLFEYSPRYYLLVHSLSHGLPSVARFTLGCVPIFMAYVGAATVFFGRTSQSFGSIGETVTTLFSLLNGDTMLDTFDSIGPASEWKSGLGRLFLGSFIMLFSYAVLNVFISIISQAWEEVHFEATLDGSPPDQLLANHRFGRKRSSRQQPPQARRLHTAASMDDSEDDALRCLPQPQPQSPPKRQPPRQPSSVDKHPWPRLTR